MDRWVQSILTASLLTASSTSADAPENPVITPGLWSYSASTLLPGASQGRQCVPLDKIDEFISGPHNKHYHCVYPSKSVTGGHAAFEGVCIGKHGQRYSIKITGAYTRSSFDLSGSIYGKFLFDLPISLPISIHARWIGPDCPAP